MIGNVAIPASYTVFAAFQADLAAAGATQVLIGSASSAFPRMAMTISSTGAPGLAHNAPPSSVGVAYTVQNLTPTLLWGSFDASTKEARLAVNSLNPQSTATFTDAHTPGTTMGFGAIGDGGSPFKGDFSHALVFNAVLSSDDRARALRYLSVRTGIAISRL